MADTIKSSNTVDVQLYDQNNNLNTIKIENPVENITKSLVMNKFSPLVSSGYFNSSYGSPIVRVGTVTLNESTKTILEGSAAVINATPINVTTLGGNEFKTSTITITNGIFQAIQVLSTFVTMVSTSISQESDTQAILTVRNLSTESVSIPSPIKLKIIVEGVNHFINV